MYMKTSHQGEEALALSLSKFLYSTGKILMDQSVNYSVTFLFFPAQNG